MIATFKNCVYNGAMETVSTTKGKAFIDYKILALFSGLLIIILIFMYIVNNRNKQHPIIGINQTSTSTPDDTQSGFQYGINMSGAEFGEKIDIGVMDKDYIYPDNPKDYAYFAEKKFTVVRLPIKWERVQHEAYGELSEPDLKKIEHILEIAREHNQKVILELHNYGRYFEKELTIAEAGKLSDVWQKLAKRLQTHEALYGYELMNEPHDMPEGAEGWAKIAQKVVDDLRQVDTEHTLFIPGYTYQNAKDWSQKNPGFPINDPAEKSIYTAHIYFDSDLSGTYKKSYDDDNRDSMIGVRDSEDFRKWLEEHNVEGMFTEFGVPNNDQKWLPMVDEFLTAIKGDNRIKGAVWWSAGPWWGDYPMSLSPDANGDRPQMSILEKHTIR